MPRRHFDRQREQSILIGWVLGIFSICPDIVVTILTHSITVLTDVFRTGTDTLASFLSWLTMRKVAHGHDARYNYGYGKLESLASLAVAAAMMLSFIVIVFTAIERVHNPRPVQNITLGVVFSTIAGLANGFCWYRNRRIAQHESSPIMESQWRLYRAKTVINVCVLLSLILSAMFSSYSWSHHWAVYIDPVASLLLATILAFSAYKIVSVSVYDLLDRSLEESLEVIIDNGLQPYHDRYVAYHGLRSRKSGRHTYIELFLEFPGDLKMSDVQQRMNEMRYSLEGKIPGSRIVIIPADAPVLPV